MSVRLEIQEARATAVETDGGLDVSLGGVWQIAAPRPSWTAVRGERTLARVRLRVDEVEKWDTSLLLFLYEVQEWCRSAGVPCDTGALPEKIRTLLGQFT